jgi:phage terminase Nu1 subunit (DNA packaging protein)
VKRPSPGTDRALWLTRTEAAALVQLSPRQFDEAIKSRLAKAAIAGTGAKLRYKAIDVVAALVEYRISQLKIEGEDAALLAGDETPGLERMRLARADILEMERDKLHGKLVPIDELSTPLAQLGALIRNAAAKLARKYGNDAPELLNQAVDEAEAGWGKLIADAANNQSANGGAARVDGAADPREETAANAAVRRRGARPSDRPV